MDLQGIASSVVAAVNPLTTALLRVNTGTTTTEPDGTRVPAYTDIAIAVQVQPLSYRDLQQIDGMNLQGTTRAIYLRGRADGVVRSLNKGGDLIVIASADDPINAGVWLVTLVTEQWPNWAKVVATLQNAAP
jgi:hypothetical protein